MTDYYVSSVDGNNSDNGTTWALAKESLAGAFAAITGEGHRLFVDSAHDLLSGAVPFGINSHDLIVVSVDRTGDPEPPTASDYLRGAKESYNSNAATITLGGYSPGGAGTIEGPPVLVGLDFEITSDAEDTTYRLQSGHYFDCSFRHEGTRTNTPYFTDFSAFSIERVVLQDCSFPRAAAQVTALNFMFKFEGANVTLLNCTFDAWSPVFVSCGASGGTGLLGDLLIRGCDLSNFDDFFDLQPSGVIAGARGITSIEMCKLPASLSWWASTDKTISNNNLLSLGRGYLSDTSSTHVDRFIASADIGDIEREDTIVRTGGSSVNGNDLSLEITTSLVTSFEREYGFVFDLGSVWVEDHSGTPTVTVHMVLDSATALEDIDVSLDCYYPKASDAGHEFVTSKPTYPLAAGATLTSSSASWSGTGGFTNEQKRKITLSLTGGRTGLAHVMLRVYIPGETIYICPKLDIG